QLGLVDEHREEAGVLGGVGERPLDGDAALEAAEAALAREVDLGHAAHAEPTLEAVFAERRLVAGALGREADLRGDQRQEALLGGAVAGRARAPPDGDEAA